MKLRISPLLAALPIAFALFGCSQTGSGIGGRDHDKAQILQYVSLSPSTTEILFTSGIPANRLLGRTAACNYPTNLNQVPIVVNGTTPDFEKIAALHPQRIILEKDLYSESTIKKLGEIGAEVVVADVDTPEKYRALVIDISKGAGTEVSTSAYLDKVFASADVLKANVTDGTKIAVVIGDPATGYMVMGTKTLLAEFLRRAGAEVVGPDASQFQKVGGEQLIAMNPHIIISTFDDSDKVAKDASLKPVDAVAKGAVIGIDPDLLLRNGGRVEKLLDNVATGIGRVNALIGK